MRQRARAFTLIELLVVIVLLGILVSVAVLSVGGSSTSRELRDEARRLAALIGVMSDEAVLDSREYGLLINSEGIACCAMTRRPCAGWRSSGARRTRCRRGCVWIWN